MRSGLLVIGMLLVLSACDQFSDNEVNDIDAMQTARMNGCLECHALHTTIIGPPWIEIAKRYNDTPSTRELLSQSVKNGSSGKWSSLTGGAVMPPNSPRVSDGDISELIGFILSLAENADK